MIRRAAAVVLVCLTLTPLSATEIGAGDHREPFTGLPIIGADPLILAFALELEGWELDSFDPEGLSAHRKRDGVSETVGYGFSPRRMGGAVVVDLINLDYRRRAVGINALSWLREVDRFETMAATLDGYLGSGRPSADEEELRELWSLGGELLAELTLVLDDDEVTLQGWYDLAGVFFSEDD